GNTPTPDASWSDFADVGPAGEIASPMGRYLQYRAGLTTADTSTTPTLDRVDASFDVDTTAPATSIDNVQVTGAAATVRFSSPDHDTARFECKLDDGDYTVCTSPRQLTGLPDGRHTIAVRAIDATGNPGPATTHDLSIDTTA